MKKLMLIVLALVLATSVAFAAGTPAGTAISNYATGAYRDANGNQMADVTSNTVTTIVSQVAGVDVSPASSSSNMVLFGTVTFPLTVTNTGNGDDTFDLSNVLVEVNGGTHTSKVYYDANGNGVKDGAEAIVSETDELSADASYSLVVVVENVDGEDGTQANITITATSQFDSNVADAAAIATEISTSEFTFTLTADITDPQPGAVVTYTLAVNNTGSADAQSVVLPSYIPVNTTYVSGSLKVDGVAQSDGDDADDASYTGGASPTVSFEYDEIAGGASASAKFQVVVNDNVPVGTVIPNAAELEWENILGEEQITVDAAATGATLTVAQIYFVAVGVDQVDVGDPSDYVHYAVTVTNTGNGPDVMVLTEVCDLIEDWQFYLDANQNGQIDEGETTITNTATMAQGAVVYLVAKGKIPAGTADETVSVMTLTATSTGNITETDEGELTITVTAPILTLVKAVSPTGNQPPGTVLTYTVTMVNVGTGQATTLVIEDDVPANTTYQAGSMKLGGVAKTDNDDSDEAKLDGNTVVFELPTLSAGGTTTLQFKTKIN